MCNCLEMVKERYEMPFVIPIFINENKDLKSMKWAIRLFNLTESGNMSKTGQATLLIDYCPLCGEKISDKR